MNDQKEKQQ